MVCGAVLCRICGENWFLWSGTSAFVAGGIVLLLRIIGIEADVLLYFLTFLLIAVSICLQDGFHIGKVASILTAALAVFTMNRLAASALLSCAVAPWLAYPGAFALLAAMAAVCFLTVRKFLPSELMPHLFPSGENEDSSRGLMITCLYFLCSAVLLPMIKVDSAFNAFMLSGASLLLFVIYILAVSGEARNSCHKAEVENEKMQRRDTESYMNTIRSQRHDYNFHLQTLSELIDRGDIEECRKYVDQLVEDSSVMNQLLPVADPAIAALINTFRIKALRYGIALTVEITDDLSHISTNEYETNKIIGNLLQNAIDEVRTHRDMSYGIHLSILKRGEFNLIRVSNRVEPERIAELLDDGIYRQGYTTKEGHDGVGLCSVRSLVRRYKGEIYTRIEDDIVHFVASVPVHYGDGV